MARLLIKIEIKSERVNDGRKEEGVKQETADREPSGPEKHCDDGEKDGLCVREKHFFFFWL